MSGPTRRIAVVEDEETIREGICLALRRDGHAPAPFDDGLTAWEAFEKDLPDLVVLDIGLPRLDGLDLCRRLRARTASLPIIFVTSREEEFDRVLGLEIGADDYLCKPFSMRELMARVRVLLRIVALVVWFVVVGGLTLDPLRISVSWRGLPVPLTVTEFLLLQSLVRRPGIVKSREQLMEDAYPDQVSVSDRTIDSHIKRIRRKFSLADPTFDGIDGVYGAGYRYQQNPA